MVWITDNVINVIVRKVITTSPVNFGEDLYEKRKVCPFARVKS